MEVIHEDKEQVSFQYANECDLEIHCSPFGLSGLYIKIKGTNIMGIGSTMGLVTGSTKGLIHYNDSQDLMDQKYKLYVVVEEDGMLRIDFTKISPLSQTEDMGNPNQDQTAMASMAQKQAPPPGTTGPPERKEEDFIGRSPNSISTGDNSSYSSSLKSPQNVNLDKTNTATSQDVENTLEEDDVPSIIFRGKCPDGRPDNIEPFIGIFSFEQED